VNPRKYLPEIIPLCILLIAFAFAACSAGCISRLADSGSPGPTTDSLGVTLLNQESHWSPSDGCYWTVTYQVYNFGNATSKGSLLKVELNALRNQEVRDTKTVYVMPLKAQEAVPVTVTLDGECIGEYGTRASVLSPG
jgi:hypothetical protein